MVGNPLYSKLVLIGHVASLSQVLSHGALFSWLEIGAVEAPVVVCLDLDGMGEPPAGAPPDPAASEAASMSWLTSVQPVGANLIVASSQPAAVRTVKERYFWSPPPY